LFFEVDLGVDLGGHDGAVAEQGLDVFDVDVVFEQQGGEGVAKDVRGDLLGDIYAFGEAADEYADGLVGKFVAEAVDKEVAAGGFDFILIAVAVGLQGEKRVGVAELDHSLFAAFTVNGNGTCLEVEGVAAEVGNFGYPCAGRKQQLDNDGVPDGFEVGIGVFVAWYDGCVNFFQQFAGFAGGEGFGQQGGFFDFDLEFADRVSQDVVFKFEVVEKCFQGGDLAFDGFGFPWGKDPQVIFEMGFINLADQCGKLAAFHVGAELQEVDAVKFDGFA